MTVLKKWLRLAMLGITLAGASAPILAASSYLAYVGTYTASSSKGIYSFRFDPATGQLKPIGVAAELPNPSFLATDPQHRKLRTPPSKGTSAPVRKLARSEHK